MVTIERRVGGLLRYRKVWFPSHEAVHEISQSLRPNDVVRFFGASADLGMFPSLVKHRQLRTAWVDLSAGPDGILQGMKKKSCRYEIRRAEKMLDRVEIELNSPKAHRDFLGVYNDFAKTKGLPRFPAAWLREYATHGETLVLYLNGEPLCCHFLLCDSQARIVRLLYSGAGGYKTQKMLPRAGRSTDTCIGMRCSAITPGDLPFLISAGSGISRITSLDSNCLSGALS